MNMHQKKTSCKQLAASLHAAVVALQEARKDLAGRARGDEFETDGSHWTDSVGKHLALAVAALPDSVLRDWLMDDDVVGGEEIYHTLRAGARARVTAEVAA